MYIGYNVQKINEMMKDMLGAGNNALEYVANSYATVEATLRKNWVGPDEQDFEKRLINRLNKLDESIKQLIVNANKNIYNLGCAWADFQDKNTIGGESTGEGAKLKLQLDKPHDNWYMYSWKGGIFHKPLEFNGSENLGLTDAGSPRSMQQAIEEFVRGTEANINKFFSQVDSANAFFGDKQKQAVVRYISEVGSAVSEIKTAIKDFYDAMYKLTGTSYSQADADVDSSFTATDLVGGLDGLGESRWGSSGN